LLFGATRSVIILVEGKTSSNFCDNCLRLYLRPYVVMIACDFYVGRSLLLHTWLQAVKRKSSALVAYRYIG